ncbi:MAG TPA: hypothetical protein VIK74_06215 [Parasegetibacter sp.]
MKRFYQLIMVAFMAFSLTSCVKEGPMGPAGPIGERGEQGERGEKGEKGDTGQGVLVKEFVFDNVTVATTPAYTKLDIDVPKEDFDNSIILVYGQRGVNWMMIPGAGSGNTNTYRFYTTHNPATTTNVYIARVTGPGPETFNKIRILLIPM